TLEATLDAAAGYAVFPTIGKGGAGIGGAYGKGVLYEDGQVVGYCDVSQGTIGFQLGGQAYTQIIAFESDEKVNEFKNGDLTFAAQATAVAIKSGAGANAEYADGVAVFTSDEAGLMYEASVGGQKFSYQPK
ncbi:MAG: YSC84-related protein, partial [Phycisphaeraceae bacterium]